jgi:transcription elongation factor Elf1
MTSIKSLPAHATATTPPPENRQKAMLFCPSCGHESPVNGDWDVQRTDEDRVYSCPWCHTVISNRPDSER